MSKRIALTYEGVVLDIEYAHQISEKPETGPEAQYPGCGEDIEILELKHKGDCMLGLLDAQLSKISNAIFIKLLEDLQEAWN